ncbi:MAG: TIGR00282 family metallophosphoesterase [Bacteroidota bacterium]|nr:TIGR00282 family metallophosphoesterase [Candidatus Kapabacteria bacterium]MCS7303060.1 TIGR00282 family metallophosphoesterase [Candidatus Kapabacteria bacterium]MCX7937623.1 TIGR00282 family metallophosphoesterase [Chlorobiota bacterium]MDW8075203.1 TIGR00282 family metallophosphoesterase [Bacteroidota bacterium]MDW8272435.1 TIGR00282 family metallophosphoesterase [Bacteroidota bacterium]
MDSPIRILFIGDIVGTPTLERLCGMLGTLRTQYAADLIIANAENVCDGKGPGKAEAEQLFAAGVDVITTGNHVWENWKSRPLLASNPRVLRPQNYPAGNPGSGVVIVETPKGPVGVLQVQGRVYMPPIDCPFRTAQRAVEQLRTRTLVIVVDFHAEATAEKIALARYLDGSVTAVLGTHTHVQTNDARILPNGTAFVTDVGMSGAFNSVIGMATEVALRRFLYQTAHKFELASGDWRISGAVVTADPSTGKALTIETFCLPCPEPTSTV